VELDLGHAQVQLGVNSEAFLRTNISSHIEAQQAKKTPRIRNLAAPLDIRSDPTNISVR